MAGERGNQSRQLHPTPRVGALHSTPHGLISHRRCATRATRLGVLDKHSSNLRRWHPEGCHIVRHVVCLHDTRLEAVFRSLPVRARNYVGLIWMNSTVQGTRGSPCQVKSSFQRNLLSRSRIAVRSRARVHERRRPCRVLLRGMSLNFHVQPLAMCRSKVGWPLGQTVAVDPACG